MPSRRIAIAGLGTIGRTVVRRIADGLPRLALSAIATRDRAKAQAWLDQEGIACPLISLDELPAHADLVLECAPAEILDQICRPMLEAGKAAMVMSASALLPRPDLVELARARGGQIIVPTGALLGFDAVIAAGRGHHQQRSDYHAQAARRPCRRTLPRQKRDIGRPVGFSAARFQG